MNFVLDVELNMDRVLVTVINEIHFMEMMMTTIVMGWILQMI
jgi:hypothetical protein